MKINRHGEKIAAPVIVVICIVLHYAIIGMVLFIVNLPVIVKMLGIVFSIIVTILFIMVLVDRIREIRSGAEDDLGKY